MTAAPDTSLVTGPNLNQVPAGSILVTPTGGTQDTLEDLLATSTGGAVAANSITGNLNPLPIAGLAATQGGAITITGGASSTSANAGGAVSVVGGAGGATGIGGAVSMTGAAGRGGAVGGAASVIAGAGQGTGNGAVATLRGGASGAGATGNGGVAAVTGGAASSTDGSGGNVTVASGASAGSGAGASITLTPGAVSTGAAGGVFTRGLQVLKQGAPTALTTSATLTAAQILTGILTANQGAAGAASYQLPLASDLQAALPADFANNDAIVFSLINISTVAAEDATITTNTGWTLIGSMVVESNDSDRAASSGRFMARRTATNTYTLYRIS